MPSPSKFISDSDLASTPAPITGAVVLTLTTPASQYVPQGQTIEIKTEAQIDGEFDSLCYIITCNEEPTLIAYNGSVVLSRLGTYLRVGVVPTTGNKAQLYGTYYSNIQSLTFSGQYTFRAIVIPIRTPYNQS